MTATQLVADLAEADRRAGAAERECARVRAELEALQNVVKDALREAGLPESASFGCLWSEVRRHLAPMNDGVTYEVRQTVRSVTRPIVETLERSANHHHALTLFNQLCADFPSETFELVRVHHREAVELAREPFAH